MKWNGHLMKSNHIIGVKWSAVCLYVKNDCRSLKRHNEGKKTVLVVIINFIPILQKCHIDYSVCLHATLLFPNLFAYAPSIVWCRFKTLDSHRICLVFFVLFCFVFGLSFLYFNSPGYLLIYPPQIATVMKPISFCSEYNPVSHTKSLGESREWNMVFRAVYNTAWKHFKK